MLGLMLLLAVAVIGVWVRVAQTLLQPVEHKPPIGQVSGIVWGGRVFTSSGQLRTFLESRGLSYARWAKAHPYAFTGGPPPATTTQVAVAKTKRDATATTATATTATTSSSERRAAPQVSGGVDTQRLVTLLLIAAAATLALVGTIAVPALLRLARGLDLDPERRLAVFARALYVDPERRLAIFAAGLAILAGLVIAYFLV